MQPEQQNPGRLRLGDLLVKAGVLTAAQLRIALEEQRRFGGRLGDILVRMRYLSEDVFVRALSKQLRLPRADLDGRLPVPPEALGLVPRPVAEEYEIVPCALLDDSRTLGIATSDPLNVSVQDALAQATGCRVVPYVAGPGQIREAIARLYGITAPPSGETTPLRILSNAEDLRPTPVPATRSMPLTAPVPAPPAQEATRRPEPDVAALVELLAQKGLITRDEYQAAFTEQLAKLRRQD